jgi:hypothetical protein
MNNAVGHASGTEGDLLAGLGSTVASLADMSCMSLPFGCDLERAAGVLPSQQYQKEVNDRFHINTGSEEYKGGVGLGLIATSLIGGEAADGDSILSQLGKCLLGGESFSAGTRVLLATGRAVPISFLTAGDTVLASDTRTGKDQPETVTAVMVHHDTDLYNLTVKTSAGTEVIHTTSNHPFWDPYLDKFTPADHLKTGERLKTPDGQPAVVVGGSTPAVHDGWMWDLTVQDDHDFYVEPATVLLPPRAGPTAVLVHNCNIPWSSGSVSRASRALDEGATSVLVNSRSEAEELFLGKYQGAGYRNASGFDGPGTRQYFGSKVGTYHWDDQLGEDGRVLGHGPGNSDGDFPHLQIHTLEGPIVRIFWSL